MFDDVQREAKRAKAERLAPGNPGGSTECREATTYREVNYLTSQQFSVELRK